MKYFYSIILLCLSVLFLDSCSIQSRRYRKGFHVESLARKTKHSSESKLQTAKPQPKPENLSLKHLPKKESEVSINGEQNLMAQKSESHQKMSPIKKAHQSYKTFKQFKKSIQLEIDKGNALPTKIIEDGSEKKYNRLAVASFVLVISSLVLSFIPIIPGILFLLGFIFSIIALVQLKNKPQKGRGLAIAALVIASILIFILLIALLLVVLIFAV